MGVLWLIQGELEHPHSPPLAPPLVMTMRPYDRCECEWPGFNHSSQLLHSFLLINLDKIFLQNFSFSWVIQFQLHGNNNFHGKAIYIHLTLVITWYLFSVSENAISLQFYDLPPHKNGEDKKKARQWERVYSESSVYSSFQAGLKPGDQSYKCHRFSFSSSYLYPVHCIIHS